MLTPLKRFSFDKKKHVYFFRLLQHNINFKKIVGNFLACGIEGRLITINSERLWLPTYICASSIIDQLGFDIITAVTLFQDILLIHKN